jgi:hypothetical protein
MDIVFRTLEKLKEAIFKSICPEAFLHSKKGFHYNYPFFQYKVINEGIHQIFRKEMVGIMLN